MKYRETKLSHTELTRLLDYNPETGVFTWKIVTSNRVKVGGVAGSPDRNGHLLICLNGTKYAAHRLAWFFVYKVWPEPEIDHINRVKTDNRIANLREATRNQNNRNVGIKRSNKTGFKGVIFHSQSKHKFVAQITVNGKTRYLGIFDTPEEAHAAYVAASEEHHGEYGVTH
jgi:hypothetical protein